MGGNTFFCLHCLEERRFYGAYAVANHVKREHGVDDPDLGEDYCDQDGWHDRQRFKRMRVEREGEAFARALESIRGADDFVFEGGG